MKIFKYIFVLLFIGLSSCDSDDSNTVIIDEEGKELTLVNPFPNLSFNQPLDLQSPNDDTDRIFVVEKRGRIVVFNNDAATTSTTDFIPQPLQWP